MKLSFEQIQNVTTGAAEIKNEDGYVCFYRMTEEQLSLYTLEKKQNKIYIPHLKARGSAGICLKFFTNSKTLNLSGITIHAGRDFYSIDVTVNGKPFGHIDNFSDKEIPKFYATMSYPDGEFSKQIDLGSGEKKVVIHLPYATITKFSSIELDDGSFIKPAKSKNKVLFFGDSITHGYDVIRNYNRYANLLSETLDADEYSKAVGGEVFYPELALTKEDFIPDYIVVAYGTNDFTKNDEHKFQSDCESFYSNLVKQYPTTTIFALSPIIRRDLSTVDFGDYFYRVGEFIKSCAEKYKNVKYVKCLDFVPDDEKFFSDSRLHPNDEGFKLYHKGLVSAIKKLI